MSREIVINGETLVLVKGNGALQDGSSGKAGVWELGLAEREVRIIPTFYHKDLKVNDFGDNVPAELLWDLADVTIKMALIHYDTDVLDACLAESMAGTSLADDAGGLVAAGTMMGGGTEQGEEGNHYISLSLLSPVLDFPWHFPTAYLTGPPVEIPLGTKRTIALLTWRVIPYRSAVGGDVTSGGAVLWDHNADSVSDVDPGEPPDTEDSSDDEGEDEIL